MENNSEATPGPQYGVVRKPLIEKIKLLALFILIGALVYVSTPAPATFVPAFFIVLAGALVRVWAGGHLTRDQKLTTSGPYQFTRNPFYLGRFLLIIGFALMSGIQLRPVQIILVVALIFFFGFYMPRKEKREGGRLREMFGEDYAVWKSNVPMLFPRLTPFRMNNRPWSRELFMGGDDLYTGNKELWTTIATFILVALFYWRMHTLPPLHP